MITIHYYRDTYEYMPDTVGLPFENRIYRARVRPVAPPLLLHRVDQIIFSTCTESSTHSLPVLNARRTDLASWRSRDIADILIKQIGHFNRVIERERQRAFKRIDMYIVILSLFTFYLGNLYNWFFSLSFFFLFFTPGPAELRYYMFIYFLGVCVKSTTIKVILKHM